LLKVYTQGCTHNFVYHFLWKCHIKYICSKRGPEYLSYGFTIKTAGLPSVTDDKFVKQSYIKDGTELKLLSITPRQVSILRATVNGLRNMADR
jgi:hypothetical protein